MITPVLRRTLTLTLFPLSALAPLACAQNAAPPQLPAPVDMGAVTGALNDDCKDKPKSATPSGPRHSAEDIHREAADNKDWQQVKLSAETGLAQNPAQAIDTYKRFFGSRALHPNVGAAETAAIAELYVGLKDEDNAVRIYDWPDKEYQGVPATRCWHFCKPNKGRIRCRNFTETLRVTKLDKHCQRIAMPEKDAVLLMPVETGQIASAKLNGSAQAGTLAIEVRFRDGNTQNFLWKDAKWVKL